MSDRAIVLAQARMAILVALRTPRTIIFSIAFPIVLLVLFNSIFNAGGNETATLPGDVEQQVHRRRVVVTGDLKHPQAGILRRGVVRADLRDEPALAELVPLAIINVLIDPDHVGVFALHLSLVEHVGHGETEVDSILVARFAHPAQ